MDTYYDKLTDYERDAIEVALDTLQFELRLNRVYPANDDRAARAAEALAIYIVASKP